VPKRRRQPNPPEFSQHIADFARPRRTSAEIAKVSEPTGQRISNGVKQANLDAGGYDEPTDPIASHRHLRPWHSDRSTERNA
jgi:hypothetical protein